VLDWLEHNPTPASLAIVWLPMLPLDDAAAACSSATRFHDARVVQFWDPERLAGKQWSVDFQVAQARAALDSLPADHPYRAAVQEWIADPPSVPMWDAAYFYPQGVRWGRRIPKPTAWTKQLGFWGVAADSESAEAATDEHTHGFAEDELAPPATGQPSTEPGMPPARDTPGEPAARESTGLFWNHTHPYSVDESDWFREFAAGMQSVTQRAVPH